MLWQVEGSLGDARPATGAFSRPLVTLVTRSYDSLPISGLRKLNEEWTLSVIVGVDCSDCVILARSGATRRVPRGEAGIAGPLIEGLRAVAGRAVIGYSGPEELSREVTAALERYFADRDPRELSPEAHSSGIQAVLSQPVRLAAAMTRALKGLPGGAIPENSLISGETLIALPGEGGHALYMVDGECAVTQIKQGSCYAAIGPAKLAAESFLRFLQRVLWREGRPTRAAGQFAAYWATRHVIDLEGGSSRSIQLVRLSGGAAQAADIVWYGERIMAALRRAVDAGVDEFRSELKRRVLIDFEGLGENSTAMLQPPVRKRVPEVRVTIHPPRTEEGRPRW